MRDQLAEGKDALRRRLIGVRRELPADTRAEWSAEICRRVRTTEVFRRAAAIVSYRPIGAEVDPSGIDREVRASGRDLYYPGGTDAPRFQGATQDVDGGALLGTAESADTLFLVPGVAFDEAGGRLGRGRGWYDRALTGFERAARVGLAFEVQIVPSVPATSWDVSMDAVVTERRCILPQRSRLLGGNA